MRALMFFCLALAWHAATLAAPGDAILGHWMVESDDAIIKIFKVKGGYRGKLAWLSETTYPLDDPRGIGGETVKDRYNPDPSLRQAPLLGKTILEGLEFDGMHLWRNGRIYNSENGKSYDCRIRLIDKNHLNLRGFFATPLLGANTVWTRVEAPM